MSPGRSRLLLEINPLDFREGVGVAATFCIHGIGETRQGRTRPRIAQDSLPGQVPLPLRHKRRQVLNQFGSVAGRKTTDGRLDLLKRTQAPTLTPKNPYLKQPFSPAGRWAHSRALGVQAKSAADTPLAPAAGRLVRAVRRVFLVKRGVGQLSAIGCTLLRCPAHVVGVLERMTVRVVSVPEAARKTGRECQASSQFPILSCQ